MNIRIIPGLLAIFAVGCGPLDSHGDNVAPASPYAEYEKIANAPSSLDGGLYKFYDIPEQRVCYFAYSGYGSALSCGPIDPALQAHRSAIYETPSPDR